MAVTEKELIRELALIAARQIPYPEDHRVRFELKQRNWANWCDQDEIDFYSILEYEILPEGWAALKKASEHVEEA